MTTNELILWSTLTGLRTTVWPNDGTEVPHQQFGAVSFLLFYVYKSVVLKSKVTYPLAEDSMTIEKGNHLHCPCEGPMISCSWSCWRAGDLKATGDGGRHTRTTEVGETFAAGESLITEKVSRWFGPCRIFMWVRHRNTLQENVNKENKKQQCSWTWRESEWCSAPPSPIWIGSHP